MGYAGGLITLILFHFNRRGLQLVEQPDALTQQDGDLVNMDLVDQPRVEGLLEGAGGAKDYVLIPAACFAWWMASLDPIGDEDER